VTKAKFNLSLTTLLAIPFFNDKAFIEEQETRIAAFNVDMKNKI
jgi:hypothetical protein